MVTLATSQSKKSSETHVAPGVNGFPGENEFKDLQFKLANNLQSTLDLHTALELFYHNIQDAVKVSGLVYKNPEGTLSFTVGTERTHKANYTISSTQSHLGEVTFSRGKRFAEPELATLEMLISVLFFPLRNALLYREALENSMRDTLTGIGNRAAMDACFSREIKLAKRHNHDMAMLLVDIDHFKRINDTVGHRNGDRVLQHVVTAMQSTLRDTDQIFRYGGEEFVLLLNNSSLECAKLTAERIRLNVAMSPIQLDEHDTQVTISIGVTPLDENDTSETIFERADAALYTAKNSGRNRVYCLKENEYCRLDQSKRAHRA